MTRTETFALRALAALLLATVVTQCLYVALPISGTPAALLLWRVEALAFLAMAVLGFGIARTHPLAAGGLVTGGLANLVQVSVGITLFEDLAGSGAVAFAFVLYHAGKVALAVAALALGAALLARRPGAVRFLGIATAIAGGAALLANGAAVLGADITFIAGGVGTGASALLALALLAQARPAPDA